MGGGLQALGSFKSLPFPPLKVSRGGAWGTGLVGHLSLGSFGKYSLLPLVAFPCHLQLCMMAWVTFPTCEIAGGWKPPVVNHGAFGMRNRADTQGLQQRGF